MGTIVLIVLRPFQDYGEVSSSFLSVFYFVFIYFSTFWNYQKFNRSSVGC